MNIQAWRKAKGWSQETFAVAVEEAGQSVLGESYVCEGPMVSRWELGKNVPAGHHLLAILLATGGTITPREGKISLVDLVQGKSRT